MSMPSNFPPSLQKEIRAKMKTPEIVEALLPFAQLDIQHLANKPDSWIVFAINDTLIRLRDLRRAKKIVDRLMK